MTRRNFTPVQDASLRAEYEAGSYLNALAAKYSASRRSITRAILRAGGKIRPAHRPSGFKNPGAGQRFAEYNLKRLARRQALLQQLEAERDA